MIANGQFVAELVLASAQGLASITAQKLLERRPQVAARFGPDARTQWRDSVISRLEYLAAALSTGSPAILANQFDWSRIAHEARGGTEAAADFDEAIRLLREVLLQELPGPNGQLAASYLDRAMTPPKGSRGHSGLTQGVARTFGVDDSAPKAGRRVSARDTRWRPSQGLQLDSGCC